VEQKDRVIVMRNEDKLNPRENFLLSIIYKLIDEYKSLYNSMQRKKLFKIVAIGNISSIPGETEFTVQVTNKNCALQITAADLIRDYNLSDFSEYHSDLIRAAAQGKLIEFLKLADPDPLYKVVSKKIDKELGQYVFTLENKNNDYFIRTAEEIAHEKNILMNLDWLDVYDVGYTHGIEGILKEKCALTLAKNS
jgi:hypothetical protein